MKRKWAAAAIACAAAVSMSVTAYAAEPSENTEMVSVQEETGEIPKDSTAQAGTEGETEETGTEDQTEKTEGSADTEAPEEDGRSRKKQTLRIRKCRQKALFRSRSLMERNIWCIPTERITPAGFS